MRTKIKSVMKLTKLDYMILKPYRKALPLVLLALPCLVTLSTDTISGALSFVTVILSITVRYPFFAEEKYDLTLFYGFLPVSRRQQVQGRYLLAFLSGPAVLGLHTILQILFRSLKGNAPSFSETAGAYFICIFLYSIFVCIQLPAYYRFGVVQGRLFIFIPILLLAMISYIVPPADLIMHNPASPPVLFTAALTAGTVVIMLLVIAVSVRISVRIVEKKDW